MMDDHEELPTFQRPLIEERGPKADRVHHNWRQEAEHWIETHPKACSLLLFYARELVRRQRHFGAKLLIERLRWEGAVEGWKDEEWKCNNAHTAYIARWLIAQDPTLEPYLSFRHVEW